MPSNNPCVVTLLLPCSSSNGMLSPNVSRMALKFDFSRCSCLRRGSVQCHIIWFAVVPWRENATVFSPVVHVSAPAAEPIAACALQGLADSCEHAPSTTTEQKAQTVIAARERECSYLRGVPMNSSRKSPRHAKRSLRFAAVKLSAYSSVRSTAATTHSSSLCMPMLLKSLFLLYNPVTFCRWKPPGNWPFGSSAPLSSQFLESMCRRVLEHRV